MIGSEWEVDDYTDVANAVWTKADKSKGTSGVVALAKDGSKPIIFHQFVDKATSRAAFASQVQAAGPDGVVYVALYDQVAALDNTGKIDESWPVGVPVPVKTHSPIWGWFVGMGALGVLGFAFAKRKRSY